MKKIMLTLSILFSSTTYAVNSMELCASEIKSKCKEMPFNECQKKVKLSPNCVKSLSFLKDMQDRINVSCGTMADHCKLEKRTENGPALKTRLDKFTKCIKASAELASPKCKEKMKLMTDPSESDKYDKAFKN